MIEIFLKGRKAGISDKEIEEWLTNTENFDPRTWTLKPGAPKKIVDLFPDYVDYCLTTGQDKEEFPESIVDYSNPSTLLVSVWQLARDARILVDVGIAANVIRNYVDKLEAHARELESLRDKIHDALLTDNDKANGAVPRSERQ
jgi:hypothetical protein